jgi:hypothetical protein
MYADSSGESMDGGGGGVVLPTPPPSPVGGSSSSSTRAAIDSVHSGSRRPAPCPSIRDIKRIGPYAVGSKLGEGAFAVVRKGIHQHTMEPVSSNNDSSHTARTLLKSTCWRFGQPSGCLEPPSPRRARKPMCRKTRHGSVPMNVSTDCRARLRPG